MGFKSPWCTAIGPTKQPRFIRLGLRLGFRIMFMLELGLGVSLGLEKLESQT